MVDDTLAVLLLYSTKMKRAISLLVILVVVVSTGHARISAMREEIERELESFYGRDSETDCGDKPADIVFVLDESGSIWGPDFQSQLKFVSDVIKSFDVEINRTHFGVLTFADDPVVHFQLTEHHHFGQLNAAIHNINQRRGQTFTHLALETMWQEMFSPIYSRSWVPHIGIVITDGASHYPELTEEEADNARQEGITMFAIGVGKSTSVEELNNIGNSPSSEYVFNVTSYSALEGIREQLAIKTCQVTTPEPPTTTTTTPIPSTAPPTTQPPPSIQRCTARGPVDVLFALPDQAGVEDTDLMLQFVASVSSQLEMSEEQALVGVTRRDCDDIQDDIRLGDNDVLLGLQNDLNARRLTSTETWRHLRQMHTIGFKPESGSREDSVRFGVLVIDNKSSNKTQTLRQATKAKDAGIHLITIMVGDYADELEVQQIASSSDDWFTANYYIELAGLVDGIIDRFCEVILQGNV